MKNRLKFLVLGTACLALAGCARRLASRSADPYTVPPPPRFAPPPGAVMIPGQPVAPIYPGAPPGPSSFPTAPNTVPTAPPSGAFAPPSTTPPGGFPTAPPGPTVAAPPPPGSFPTAPPRPQFYPPSPPPGPTSPFASPPRIPDPPATPPTPAPPLVPPVGPPDRMGFHWQQIPPAPPGAPTPPSTPKTPDVLLLPPVPEPSTSKSDSRPDSPEPPRAAPTPLPVGIAGFDRARDQVSTGQRPTLEGLDWLQRNGYRMIVFLHLPGETVDADRQQVEKRNMAFVPIEINSRDLDRNAVDRFLNVQRDPAAGKVFVYDLDGSIAGAMWYLSYRVIDQDSEEIARIKAGSLGQGDTRDSAREMWQAVRRYLETR